MFLKIIFKLVLKFVVSDYDFNFKFKTVVINYDFDEDTLVWSFFFKNDLDWFFLKIFYFGTKFKKVYI